MNKFIAFIRHGDYEQLANTPSAMQPFPLKEAGRQQALKGSELVLDFLKQKNLQLHPTLFSSILLRAWQTTELMQSHFSGYSKKPLVISSHEALVERRVGNVANLSIQQIEDIIKNDPRYDSPPEGWKSNSHYCLPFPGAESLMQAGQRVANFVDQEAAHLAEGELMLFIGHGAAFRHAAHHMGCMDSHKIATYSMYHAKPVFFQQVTDAAGKPQWLTYDENLWKLRHKETFND